MEFCPVCEAQLIKSGDSILCSCCGYSRCECCACNRKEEEAYGLYTGIE